jgi:4-hydroxymandelate oxidase
MASAAVSSYKNESDPSRHIVSRRPRPPGAGRQRLGLLRRRCRRRADAARQPQAWQRCQLLPRVLRPLAGGHTRCTCWAARWPTRCCWPRWPTSAWPTPTASWPPPGRRAQGRGLVLSTQASTPLEHVARTGAPTDPGPRAAVVPAVPAASPRLHAATGAPCRGRRLRGLVLTVDAPVHGARDRERRAGFRLPPGVSRRQPAGLPPPPSGRGPAIQRLFEGVLQHAPPGTTCAGCCSHPAAGAAQGRAAPGRRAPGRWPGRGGRDRLQPRRAHAGHRAATAHALPAVAQAVGGQVPVLVDGGIRRGTDVLQGPGAGCTRGADRPPAGAGAGRRRAARRGPRACACCATNWRSRWRCAAAPVRR